MARVSRNQKEVEGMARRWEEKLDSDVLDTDEEAVHLGKAREQLSEVGSFSLHVGSGCQTGHQAK